MIREPEVKLASSGRGEGSPVGACVLSGAAGAGVSVPAARSLRARLGVWLRLGRVSNLPTVWSNVLAALALSNAAESLPAGELAQRSSLTNPFNAVSGVGSGAALPLMGAFSLFYIGGMFLNDAFDREIDARERPTRPIPSGQVTAAQVFAAGFGCLVAGAMCVTAVASWSATRAVSASALSSLALAACIVLYDLHHKKNPLSPVLMGMCRVLVYFTTALAAGTGVTAAVAVGAAGLLCHLIGLTYAAKQESLNRLGSVWPLVLLAVTPVWGAWQAVERLWAAPFVLALGVWVVHSLRFLMGKPRRVPHAVVRLIAGIALVDAVWIALMGQPAWALVALGACGLTRLLQRYVPGT
jgi:4-hydroxybenzoate polyprenyltransferase